MMSDTLLTYVVVLAELGAVLFLVFLVAVIYFFMKSKKEGHTSQELAGFVKGLAGGERDGIKDNLAEQLDFPEDGEISMDTLMRDERQLYNHLVKFSINKDASLLKSTTSGIHSLIESYLQLLTIQTGESEGDGVEAGEGKKSKTVMLKKENEQLRLKLTSLEKRLQNATDTIESMMGEFSLMYEGGKKEGEKKIQNDVSKLKQSLEDEEAHLNSEVKELNLDDT